MLALAMTAGGPAFGALVFTPNYNDAAMSAAGLTAGQITSVHTAFAAATALFASNFNDNIHINITVTAVAGTGTLGQSNTFLNSFSYAAIRAALIADSKTANDVIAVGAGGSVGAADPVATAHNWWVSTAQAKALGLIADNATTDGTFTFGAGFNYAFDPNSVGVGQYDFQGVAMHEISEIMGRIAGVGISIGGSPAYLASDLFRYTGPGVRGLTNGGGISFSEDGGATLVKLFNNNAANGGDAADWAGGTNDSFNAFGTTGVKSPLTAVDLQIMDAIGYDAAASVPEPTTGLVTLSGLVALGFLRRRAKAHRP